jgi:hypothetical protein
MYFKTQQDVLYRNFYVEEIGVVWDLQIAGCTKRLSIFFSAVRKII